MRRTRYSPIERGVRAVLEGHSFGWFVGGYVAVTLAVLLAGALLNLYTPWLLPDAKGWSGIDGFLKDATSYLIAAQVGLLAVVSVAVGLVTLIAQRDDRASTNTDIRLYYDGALAYEVVASSVALLLILCVQIFWPFHPVVHALGFERSALFDRLSLSGLHLVWLVVNITAFAQFIAITLRFVEPKAREQLRERYTANSVVPDDLWRRILPWLYLTAPSLLLPEAATDSGPLLAFGHNLSDTGDPEITTFFRGRVMLKNVRSRLLGAALRHWWRRTDEARRRQPQQRASPFGREIALVLTPHFGREFEGSVVWCRRSGGAPLTRWERGLIRRSFVFGKTAGPGRDLPMPANFIEELADRVIGQIDRLAITGFKSALDELVRYHKFLLEVYASRSVEGAPQSLAEIGGLWEQPHQEWTRQYRRVFERAAARLAEETHFAETMAHLPYRLLPDDGREHSASMVESILDMGLWQVVFLEAWVTRRTSVEVAPDAAAQPRLVLAGSDRRAYEHVVLNSIGAWESTLQLAGGMYGWTDSTAEPARLWGAFGASWPYLARHLRNTAFCLASAVWNEDAIGAARHRDALLRWIDTVKVGLEADHILDHQLLLTPEFLGIEWNDVAARLTPFRRGLPGYAVTPWPLFGSILQRAFDEVIVLTAAVTLAWFLREQQATDIGGRTANLLLRRQTLETEGAQQFTRSGRPETTFESVFSIIIRQGLMDRLGPGRYRTRLDALVGFLGQMSERRVVPGRVYTSWGLGGLDTVTLPLLAMLLAHTPDNGDCAIVARLSVLASDEDLFADGDDTFRRLLFDITALAAPLADPTNHPALERGLQVLAPGRDFAAALARLQAILTAATAAIEQRRGERLRARAVDPTKLAALREALERTLGAFGTHLPVFQGYQIRRKNLATDKPGEWIVNGIDKGQMTTPALAPPTTGLEEMIVSVFTQHLANLTRMEFGRHRHQTVRMACSAYPRRYWQTVVKHAAQFTDGAVLLVPFNPTGRNISERLYHHAAGLPADVRIERLEGRQSGGGASYVGTVEEIDVYTTQLPAERSWLFSRTTLRSVAYGRLQSGNFVDVVFEEGEDPRKSRLRVRFHQSAEWNDIPIIEIVLRDRIRARPAAAEARAS